MTATFKRSLKATLGSLLLATAGLTAQAPAESTLTGFQPNSDYILVIDGQEVAKAEVYQSQRAAAFLLMTSAFESPVLVSPRTRSIDSINLMKVAKRDNGFIDLLPNAILARQGSFELEEQDVVFQVEGHAVRLKPRPPLVGRTNADELLSYSPNYERGAASYTPDIEALMRLRGQGKRVEIKVFFGSWCSVCKRYLPHLLKVEEQLAESGIDFWYYGLPLPPAAWDDREAKTAGIQGVPTGIVYVDGKEVGRITRDGWRQVEATIDRLVKSAG